MPLWGTAHASASINQSTCLKMKIQSIPKVMHTQHNLVG